MEVEQLLADLQRRKKQAAARQDFAEAQSILEQIREISRRHQQISAAAPVGSTAISSAPHASLSNRHPSRSEVVAPVRTSRVAKAGEETRLDGNRAEVNRFYPRVVGESFGPATTTRHNYPQPQSRFSTPTTISAEPHQRIQTPAQLHPAVDAPTLYPPPKYPDPAHANYPELGTVAPMTTHPNTHAQMVCLPFYIDVRGRILYERLIA